MASIKSSFDGGKTFIEITHINHEEMCSLEDLQTLLQLATRLEEYEKCAHIKRIIEKKLSSKSISQE